MAEIHTLRPKQHRPPDVDKKPGIKGKTVAIAAGLLAVAGLGLLEGKFGPGADVGRSPHAPTEDVSSTSSPAGNIDSTPPTTRLSFKVGPDDDVWKIAQRQIGSGALDRDLELRAVEDAVSLDNGSTTGGDDGVVELGVNDSDKAVGAEPTQAQPPTHK